MALSCNHRASDTRVALQAMQLRAAARALASLLAVVVLWSVPAVAQTTDIEPLPEPEISKEINQRLEKQIETIRENLNEQASRSQDDSRKAASVLDEVRAIDQRLLSSSRKSEDLRDEEKSLEADYAQLSQMLTVLDAERAKTRLEIVKRLNGIYRRGRLGSPRVMIEAASSTEPLRMARYLAAISKADAAAMHEYEHARGKYRQTLAEMEAAKTSAAATRRELAQENAAYEKIRGEKLALLKRIESEMTVRNTEMKRLKAAEEDLAKILAETPIPEPGKDSGEAAPQPIKLVRRYTPSGEPFSKLKGRLGTPMEGEIVERFGVENGSGVRHNGIVIRPGEDRRVMAVADGEVVFAGPFPGLGNTVVINHGERYHSVYAQLDQIGPEVGQQIRRGSQVGFLAAGSTLHFELRAQGKPLDPLAWFAGGKQAFAR